MLYSQAEPAAADHRRRNEELAVDMILFDLTIKCCPADA
jgi:hypothetical protein